MVLVEQQYKDIRRKLDDMGYHQPCSVESITLVDRLLKELICTRDKLVLNEDLVNKALKNYEETEKSLEFCKIENSRLIKENNKIHLEIIKSKEESEKKVKEMKMRIADLENMYSDLEFNYMEEMTNIGALRQELLVKTNKLYELGLCDEEDDYEKLKDLFKMNVTNKHCLNDNTVSTKETIYETGHYKRKQRQLQDEIEALESQMKSRDREIARLANQLEQRNRYDGISDKKCSCHVSTNAYVPQTLLTSKEMYEKLKIAKIKQHEAMERAVSLADRIQELEEELQVLKHRRDLSKQCSCKANISFLKNQHLETLNKIHDMEERLTNLQILIDNLSKEKKEAMNKITDLEKENHNLCDKLGTFKSIERDLMSEIDRLQQNKADLKNEIASLVGKNDSLQELTKKLEANITANKPTKEVESGTENENYRRNSLCEKMKAERDYYCNELHRLQEKVYSAERLHDVKCRRSENKEEMVLKKIQTEMHFAKEENNRLQGEIVKLRNQLKQFSDYKHDSNKLIDNHIKQLEYDKGLLASSNSNLKSKLFNVEQNLEQLKKKEYVVSEELENYKGKYNQLKKLNIQLELTLKNRETIRKQAEMELTESMARLGELEKELKCARGAILTLKKEKQEVKENLLKLDGEKDELMLKMDEKAILISKLDRDLHSKNSQTAQMENRIFDLQTQLETLEKMNQEAENKCRAYNIDNRKLEHELISLHNSKESVLLECESLKRELEAVSQDVILTNQALESSRKESEKLKRELQTYVDEVRRVEKILLEKERERETLLEQFNALSAEATHLETTQQSLECEANLSKDNLRDTQEKLYALQKDATEKDSLVSFMKNQVQQLSEQVIQLQGKVAEIGDRELMLSTDLDAARNLCSTLEEQKQYYNKQLSQIESNERTLRDELDRLECENESLHNQLNHEQKNNFSMEQMLSTSRHETMQKSLYNEDLTTEVNRMKKTVIGLESKLNSVTSALSQCQNACADYHTQNVHLKRQITNDKFERAKDLDSNSTSL